MKKKQDKKYDVQLVKGLSIEDSFKKFEKLVKINELPGKRDKQNKPIDLKIKLTIKQIINIVVQFGFNPHTDYNNVYINDQRKATLTIKPGQSFSQLIRLLNNAFYMSGYHDNRNKNK